MHEQLLVYRQGCPGQKTTGTYENIEGVGALSLELQKLGYQLIKARKSSVAKAYSKRVPESDIVAFAFQFSGMYSGGMSVIQCLRTLEKQTEHAGFKTILKDICQKVEKGASLHKAFAEYKDVFSPFFLGMLEAGETGARLSTSLDMIATYLEKRNELRQKVKAAFVYPIVVAVICFW